MVSEFYIPTFRNTQFYLRRWCKQEEKSQVDSIYFDLSSAFDLVSHPVLLHKLRAHGLCGCYLSWIRSFLTNQLLSVRVFDIFSLPFVVLSGVPQGPVLDTGVVQW